MLAAENDARDVPVIDDEQPATREKQEIDVELAAAEYETEATKKRRQAQAEAKASARFGRPSRNKFKS
jgi:hypothetical protein